MEDNKKYGIIIWDENEKEILLSFTENQWKKIYELIENNIPNFNENSNFYDGIVKNLKSEAEKLNQKLSRLRDNHDMNGYIATLKSLRETLELIGKYDWQLMYSEYEIDDPTSSFKKQIAIWYQNHDNQIKNHQIWNVFGKIK